MNFPLQTSACIQAAFRRDPKCCCAWKGWCLPLFVQTQGIQWGSMALSGNGKVQEISMSHPRNIRTMARTNKTVSNMHVFFLCLQLYDCVIHTWNCYRKYFAKKKRNYRCSVLQVDKILIFSISQQSEMERYEKHCTVRWLIKFQVLSTSEATAMSIPSPWAEQPLLALT